ncbi:hypothetical protein T10_2492 [Trichinella papuae]|uniref:Uncharacterized protein n=1 Tax=Trichinella papuae TaxID=268474 RepID=A0A0V1MHY3_9BILA|nr:hypothetical protein T10_2492 [Trichinella papuae]
MAPREVKRCAATQRQDVLGSDRPSVVKSEQSGVHGVAGKALERDAVQGRRNGVEAVERVDQGGALHKFQICQPFSIVFSFDDCHVN